MLDVSSHNPGYGRSCTTDSDETYGGTPQPAMAVMKWTTTILLLSAAAFELRVHASLAAP